MAASQHIHFSATIQDASGIKVAKTSQLFIDPAQTITQVITALTAWEAALDAITEGKIVRRGVGLSSPPTTGGGKPVAGHELDDTVTFDFIQAALTTHYGDNIPGFISAGLVGDKVDLTNTAVAAYVTLLTTAPVLGGVYSGLGNEALTALYRAFQGDRTHRRQLFPKSVTYP